MARAVLGAQGWVRGAVTSPSLEEGIVRYKVRYGHFRRHSLILEPRVQNAMQAMHGIDDTKVRRYTTWQVWSDEGKLYQVEGAVEVSLPGLGDPGLLGGRVEDGGLELHGGPWRSSIGAWRSWRSWRP